MQCRDVALLALPLVAVVMTGQVHATERSEEANLNVGELVARCAPEVHPDTMLKVLKHESSFQPWVIGVNSKPRTTYQLKTQGEAAKLAASLIAEGKSIDMGLGQINSGNLAALKLTPETVFEPCTNIRAAAAVLTNAFLSTNGNAAGEQAALDQALSIYNTGKRDRGIANGYVGRVRQAKYIVPALDENAQERAGAVELQGQPAPPPPPPSWDVFAYSDYERQRAARPAQPEGQEAGTEKEGAAPAGAIVFGKPR